MPPGVLEALACGYESDFATQKDEVSSVTVSASGSPSPVLSAAPIPDIAPLPAAQKQMQQQDQQLGHKQEQQQHQQEQQQQQQQQEPVLLPFRRDDAVQGVVPLCIPRVLPTEAFLVRVEPALVPGGQEELVMLTSDTVELEVMVLPVSPFHTLFMNALRNAPSATDGAATGEQQDKDSDGEDEDDFDCRCVTYSAVLTVAGSACMLELGPVPPPPPQ